MIMILILATILFKLQILLVLQLDIRRLEAGKARLIKAINPSDCPTLMAQGVSGVSPDIY